MAGETDDAERGGDADVVDDAGATGNGPGYRWDRTLGVAGGLAGVAASLFVLLGPVVRYSSQSATGEVTTGTLSGVDYLLGHPDAQFALFAWPLLLGAVAAVGTGAAWRGHVRWTWAAAVTLAAFAVVGAMSIGGLYVPASVLLLAGAGLATWGGRD